jgi:hypothetical protein
MKRILAILVVALAILAASSAAAIAAPVPPYTSNADCVFCHSETGDSVLKPDFAVGAVDYAKCTACHWQNTHSFDQNHPAFSSYSFGDSECSACHGLWPSRTLVANGTGHRFGGTAYIGLPGFSSASGYFQSAESLATTATELHGYHVSGSFPQLVPVSKWPGCRSCHAPAACDACHDAPAATHAQHAPVTPVEYLVTRGVPAGDDQAESSYTTSSACVNDACHALAKASVAGFKPDCLSCHP